jgi:hypothetical protein
VLWLLALEEGAVVHAGRAAGKVVIAGQDVDRHVDFRKPLAGAVHDVVPDGVVVEKNPRQ